MQKFTKKEVEKMQTVECKEGKKQIPVGIPREVVRDIDGIRNKQPMADYIREIVIADTQAKTNKKYIY